MFKILDFIVIVIQKQFFFEILGNKITKYQKSEIAIL